MLQLTKNAVEKIKEFGADSKLSGDKKYFRIQVLSGGCSGFMYGFQFDDKLDNDVVIDQDGIKVIVDPMHLSYINGSIIDYHQSLTASQFVINNPNAKGCCGCGQSFGV